LRLDGAQCRAQANLQVTPKPYPRTAQIPTQITNSTQDRGRGATRCLVSGLFLGVVRQDLCGYRDQPTPPIDTLSGLRKADIEDCALFHSPELTSGAHERHIYQLVSEQRWPSQHTSRTIGRVLPTSGRKFDSGNFLSSQSFNFSQVI
jgi:hypothetical protein